MLKFLATTENTRKSPREDTSEKRGKFARKYESKIAIRNFTRIMRHE